MAILESLEKYHVNIFGSKKRLKASQVISEAVPSKQKKNQYGKMNVIYKFEIKEEKYFFRI